MVVADPTATLLTACEHGYGKRTPFGPNDASAPVADDAPDDESASEAVTAAEPEADEAEDEGGSSGSRYRAQRRGGFGVRDIKATERNGRVVGVVAVHEDDEVLMISSGGKIQRIAAQDISVIGRNTQGVRIMSLDEGDTLAAVVRVPRDETIADAPATGEP